ncbi:hypothetical protein [Paractinoplanes ferrugineus]|uniref:hypothetical protein n=1 Tax=Paractinoplanes ferrugineus TaxID=113564 RepID=UPI00194333A3|nr:hypothetical protein [Actinoplanes ferrugineus]
MFLIDLDGPVQVTPSRVPWRNSRLPFMVTVVLVLFGLAGEPNNSLGSVDAVKVCDHPLSAGAGVGSPRTQAFVLDVESGEILQAVDCPA